MSRSASRRQLDIWPAFVDAVSSLLMVVIFVLLLAAVGQLFLSDAIRGRDSKLEQLNLRITALADMLAMQTATSEQLSADLALRTASLAEAKNKAVTLKQTIEQQSAALTQSKQTLAMQSAELSALTRKQATLETDIKALEALKDKLSAEINRMVNENAVINEQLREAGALKLEAAAQVARLNQQLEQLQQQLQQLNHALEISRDDVELKQNEITALGERLNLALAAKAAELQRYRSEFFGQLRESLSDYPGVHIEGDRFVLPAGILFESASDQLGQSGRRQIAAVAKSLHEIATRIPAEIPWLLRIDGHTDKQSINTERFPSNWELSSARAITIVRTLIRAGIPPSRLAATGFAEQHPLDNGTDAAALARNRRIEIKLTRR